jgi:hypothetical protein
METWSVQYRWCAWTSSFLHQRLIPGQREGLRVIFIYRSVIWSAAIVAANIFPCSPAFNVQTKRLVRIEKAERLNRAEPLHCFHD